MFQAQVNEYRFEIDRLTRELQDVKRKYFEMRRTNQLSATTPPSAPGGVAVDNFTNTGTTKDPLLQQQNAFHASQPKITGGGFNLQATAASSRSVS
jgi:hypothetical protein